MSDRAPLRRLPQAAPDSGAAAVWVLGDHALSYAPRPLIMGILNLTPDSFHTASRHDVDSVVAAAEAMAAAGADLLDLGAESTRPGADAVGATEEQDRLLPAVERVRAAVALPLTVDTYRAETARLALAAGADGVNDIRAGEGDPAMFATVADRDAGLVLMHMRGEPGTMQDAPRYDDVVDEVAVYLAARLAAAEAAGIARERILIDPGIGFGKTLEHNLRLLGALGRLGDVAPVLLGASRKSFIAMVREAPAAERLGGSLSAVALAHAAGAAVVRVHDVAETRQFLDVLRAVDATAAP